MSFDSRARRASFALLCVALGLCGCPLPAWQGTLQQDATVTDADVSPMDADASPMDADVSSMDADVAQTDVDVAPTDADVSPTDVDVAPTDADVAPTDADVAPTDADVSPSDVDVSLADVDVAPTDADVASADADVPPTDAACGLSTPTRCGSECCAGPCAASGGCEEIIGTSSCKSEIVEGAATCAWSRSGRVWCWGSRPSVVPGRADDCTAPLRPVLITAPSVVDVREVAVGGRDICAITGGGAVLCWNDYTAPHAISVSGRATRITAGEGHVCVVLEDGSAWCRGANDFAQLGRGNYTGPDAGTIAFDDAFQPVLSAPGVALTGVAEVVAGARFSCARMNDGTVRCWGTNTYHQLGLGVGDGGAARACGGLPCSDFARQIAGLNDVAGLDAGLNHACAWLRSGALRCWGRNESDQLCRAVTENCDGTPCTSTPVEVTGVTNVTGVAVGAEHTCFTRGSGASAVVLCCGAWTHHQPIALSPTVVAGFAAGEVSSIASGAHVACATARGGVKCWGDRATGQIADASSISPAAVAVPGVTDAVEVVAGLGHTCIRTVSGGVRCWGSNRSLELGTPAVVGAWPVDTGSPVEAVLHDGLDSPLTNVTGLSAGASHTCASRRDGSLLCWGRNASFQVGRDTYAERLPAEVVVGQDAGVSASSGGWAFTCSLRAGGVDCWGADYHCQTSRGFVGGVCSGNVHADAERVALPMITPTGVTAGEVHACAWGSVDGARGGPVACWGYSALGQVNGVVAGSGASVDMPPTVVPGVASAIDVSAGVGSTCAVLSDGSVSCWGDRSCGELGRPPTSGNSAPATIADLTDASAVRLGDYFACAIVAGGAVSCWGRNDYGQLARSTPRWSYQPQAITRDSGAPLNGVVSLATGARHACAVRSDHTVWCWGDDSSGQRGLGSQSVRTAATTIVW